MKEKVIDFFKKNGRLAIFALFILELLLTMLITPDKYDDSYFIEQVTNKSIWSFVSSRYSWWTSRLIIEYVLCLVLKISKYSWILIEALMVALAGYSISRIFIKDNKNETNAMLIFMILAYPLNAMSSAGWAATTVNYMWPLATTLFALIPLKKMWDNEKIKSFQYPLYSLALIFACNQEQASAILFGAYVLFTVLYIIKNKKVHPYLIVQNIIIIASLIFIFTCPGNYNRNLEETSRHFKDIGMLSILDKIGLGFTSTMGLIFKEGNVIYALFTLILAVYIHCNYKETLYKVVAAIPFLSIIFMYYLSPITDNLFHFIISFKDLIIEEEVFLTAVTSNNLLYVVPVVFAIVNFTCIGMSLLLIFKNLKNNIAIVVYLAGLASRLIMGFSPTVFMSGERTMIFFEFAMIICAMLIWQELIKKKDKSDIKIQKRVSIIVKCVGAIQYFNILLCILYTQK